MPGSCVVQQDLSGSIRGQFIGEKHSSSTWVIETRALRRIGNVAVKKPCSVSRVERWVPVVWPSGSNLSIRVSSDCLVSGAGGLFE